MPDPRDSDDDEATSVDPPKKQPPKPAAADDDDDEATKATGTPKKARETKAILDASKRMNEAPQKKPAKKLHPLVPIGIGLLVLAALLLAVNALTGSATGDSADTEPHGLRKLFDW